jgi:hypothetical protein
MFNPVHTARNLEDYSAGPGCPDIVSDSGGRGAGRFVEFSQWESGRNPTSGRGGDQAKVIQWGRTNCRTGFARTPTLCEPPPMQCPAGCVSGWGGGSFWVIPVAPVRFKAKYG